jgi:hypothetical protein
VSHAGSHNVKRKNTVILKSLLLVLYWLLGFLFDPEDEGDTSLRNVFELLPDYMASHSKKTVLFRKIKML